MSIFISRIGKTPSAIVYRRKRNRNHSTLLAISKQQFHTLADYSKDIIDILLRAPEGLSIRKIVRHVYNAHNTLFETVPLDDIKRDVTQFLTYRSKSASSQIERTGVRGVYRLNPDSEVSQQLMLQFKEEEEKEQQTAVTEPSKDTSLDLFAGMFDD